MGSLVPSWDTSQPGVPPKGWKDYEEPLSPRGPARLDTATFSRSTSIKQGELSRQLSRQPSGPPNLSRQSAPQPLRVHSLARSTTLGSPPKLARTSTTAPGSPLTPGSPRGLVGSFSRQASMGTSAPSNFMARYFEMREGETVDLKKKERWCDRMDSHVLNVRPDEGDELAWRQGSFKPQQDMAPHTCPERDRKVTVERLAEGLERVSVDGVGTPRAKPRGSGREISPSP